MFNQTSIHVLSLYPCISIGIAATPWLFKKINFVQEKQQSQQSEGCLEYKDGPGLLKRGQSLIIYMFHLLIKYNRGAFMDCRLANIKSLPNKLTDEGTYT